jgi:hypothetical protein
MKMKNTLLPMEGSVVFIPSAGIPLQLQKRGVTIRNSE